MDPNNLYQSCLKMLNDKYKINDYPKDVFMEIYMNIYNENKATTPNNDLNKLVLIEVRNKVEKDLKEPVSETSDLEMKIREAEAIRASIAKMTPIMGAVNLEGVEETQPSTTPSQTIHVSNYQQATTLPKCKTFIVNTTKNNFKIKSMVDVKTYSIYPCYICIPADIKYKTPYLILSLNDGVKQNNYTYIPVDINHSNWDNWKPITDDYMEISLGNNNWTINFIDYLGNPLDMNEYQVIVNDVLMVNNNYTLNINKPQYFNINDKIKIIKGNGYISDNIITDINNNIITIHKNNLELNDFMDSKIINYKHNFSITFKYHIKQQG